MNVNFEYYRIFYYVAKYHNFTKAAHTLGSSQPNDDESHRAHDLLHLSAGAPQGADLPERGLHEQARGDGDG